MGKSYGFIEIQGVVAAVNALDIMCKTADVELATWERKLGGRLVTIVVQGDVAAVKQAVEAACSNGIKQPVAHGIIANPHPEVVRLLLFSASRWNKTQTAQAENKAENRAKVKTEKKEEVTAESKTENKTENKIENKTENKTNVSVDTKINETEKISKAELKSKIKPGVISQVKKEIKQKGDDPTNK